MRLAEITLKDFMGSVVVEFDNSTDEQRDAKHEAMRRANLLFSEAKDGSREYEIFRKGPKNKVGYGILELKDDNGKFCVFIVKTLKDHWEFDSVELTEGSVSYIHTDPSVIKHLVDNQDRLGEYIDIHATTLPSRDVRMRLGLHRSATVVAYQGHYPIHPENYKKYIEPYLDPDTGELLPDADHRITNPSVFDLQDVTFENYCHPNSRVIKEENFGSFEKKMISRIDDDYRSMSESLHNIGPEDFMKENELAEIRKSPVEDSRVFRAKQGRVLLMNENATIIKAMIQQGTTFVPEEFRGRGYSGDLLLSLGGHHRECLAPTHFSEGGIGARRSAHRQAVVQAHENGEWIRPSVKEHYAEVLNPEADLKDKSTPVSMAM